MVPQYLGTFDTNYIICRNVESFEKYFSHTTKDFVKETNKSN